MIVHPTKGAFDATKAVWRHADDADGDEARIEVAFVDGLVGMRDAGDPEGPVLVFTPAEWEAFVGGVEDGEFDV